MEYIKEPQKSIPVIKEVDVCIIGGGPSGLGAAIQSARMGLDTLLIEKYGRVGGSAVNELTSIWLTFYTNNHKIVSGIPEEIVKNLKDRKGTFGHVKDVIGFVSRITPFYPEDFELVVLEMCKKADVKILFHSLFTDVVYDNNRIEAVIIENIAGRQAIKAKLFIDASGNAQLAYKAGAEHQIGLDNSKLVQPGSLVLHIGGVNKKEVISYMEQNPDDFMLGVPSNEIRKHKNYLSVAGFFSKVKEAKELNEYKVPREMALFFNLPHKDCVMVNMTRLINADPLDPEKVSSAEIEARLVQLPDIMNFLKKFIPGFKNCYLTRIASQVGYRESRRIIGKYILTSDDILENKKFYDGIIKVCYPMDRHEPRGEGLSYNKSEPGEYYTLPFRCLVPNKIKNLLVVGKCISATHQALASTRVQIYCIGTGQAAGIAGYLYINKNRSFIEIIESFEEMKLIMKKYGIDI